MQVTNASVFTQQVLVANGVASAAAAMIVQNNLNAINVEARMLFNNTDPSTVTDAINQLRQWVIANLVP